MKGEKDQREALVRSFGKTKKKQRDKTGDHKNYISSKEKE